MSDVFDELFFPRDEGNVPLPYTGEFTHDDKYDHPGTSSTPGFYSGAPDACVNIGDVYAVMEDERAYRAKHAAIGALDLWAAAPVAMASTMILETMQTEAQENPLAKQMAAESNDWMINLATTPYVDWKAFGVGVAAWALVSAAGRIRAHERYPIDRDKTLQAIVESDSFTPHTVSERRKERLTHRMLRASGAIVAGVVAYKIGEHQSDITDMYAALGLVGTAATAITVSEVRSARHNRRMRQAKPDPRVRQIEY
jgi:hypothetical protein